MIKSLDTYLSSTVARLPVFVKLPMVLITNFGSPLTLGLLMLLAVHNAHLAPNSHDFKIALITLVMLPLAYAIKSLTKRQRPQTLYVERMRLKSYSFPSGHAYGSLLVFGFYAFLIGNPLAWVAAAAAVFLIGLSRVYLTAHFPSDVLAGWLLGALILALIVILS